MLTEAKKAGFPAKNCQFCHTEAVPKKDTFKADTSLNNRGKFLLTDMQKRNLKAPDVKKLKEYTATQTKKRKALPVSASGAFAASAQGVRLPEGWVGTTDQWTQGLGIVLALLNIVVLLVAWRRLKQVQSIRGVIGTLFFGLAVLPVVVMFF